MALLIKLKLSKFIWIYIEGFTTVVLGFRRSYTRNKCITVAYCFSINFQQSHRQILLPAAISILSRLHGCIWLSTTTLFIIYKKLFSQWIILLLLVTSQTTLELELSTVRMTCLEWLNLTTYIKTKKHTTKDTTTIITITIFISFALYVSTTTIAMTAALSLEEKEEEEETNGRLNPTTCNLQPTTYNLPTEDKDSYSSTFYQLQLQLQLQFHFHSVAVTVAVAVAVAV